MLGHCLGVKLFAQALNGVMKKGADVADGKSGGGGDIAITESRFELEPYEFALAFGQGFYKPLEALGVVFFLEGHGGTRRGVVDGLIKGQGSIHGHDALLFSLMIDDAAPADGEEPRSEALEIACGPVPEVTKESVLHRVTRGFRFACMMPREGKQRTFIAVEQCLSGKVQENRGPFGGIAWTAR